jgi:hypothetical protein
MGPQRLLILVGDRQYLELIAALDPKHRPPGSRRPFVTDDDGACYDGRCSRGRLDRGRGRRQSGAGRARIPRGAGWRSSSMRPNGWPRAFVSRSGGARAISTRIMHAGVLVGNLEAANAFYGGRARPPGDVARRPRRTC